MYLGVNVIATYELVQPVLSGQTFYCMKLHLWIYWYWKFIHYIYLHYIFSFKHFKEENIDWKKSWEKFTGE